MEMQLGESVLVPVKSPTTNAERSLDIKPADEKYVTELARRDCTMMMCRCMGLFLENS